MTVCCHEYFFGPQRALVITDFNCMWNMMLTTGCHVVPRLIDGASPPPFPYLFWHDL